MIAQAPGFHGKRPTPDDFMQLVRPWDRWLQDSMLAVHKSLGAAWRFVLAPGVVSAHAWTGAQGAQGD